MFRTAELGQKVSKAEFNQAVPDLRIALIEAQQEIRKAGVPVIIVFAGVDGAGKGESANLLQEWMDPRWIVTRAYEDPSEEEGERPELWRYWRDLPREGQVGIFLSAWYSRPYLDRVYGKISRSEFDEALDRILQFERMLANDGALILKFWMHLGKKAQEKRFKKLEKDLLQAWRVTKKDWKHWKLYDKFIDAAEHTIMKTSIGRAPWTIVEGADARFRGLKVGQTVLEGIRRRIGEVEAETAAPSDSENSYALSTGGSEDSIGSASVLSALDMTKALPKDEYRNELDKYQAMVNLLSREARERKISTILVFEGWDAGGKGGNIRRITAALDARDYQVIPIAAPTDEELSHHYLWRFWRHLPRGGRFTFFDRSWYGRVLVERIEGFATEKTWRRAYGEINNFESHLVDHGDVLLKFWLHVTKEEQAARFKAREEISFKRWKLTEEDWRNREKWDEYEIAVNDMVAQTSTRAAPWVLVEGNNKRFARIKVLKTICRRLHERLSDD
ncbi:MAG: polyphosphate:AMP phosphotransferase [Planctomycetota bacterium]